MVSGRGYIAAELNNLEIIVLWG